jgi:hypothetical protein
MKSYDKFGFKKPIKIGEFKSKLEFVTFLFITTKLKMMAIYEPETVKTKIGNYTPDFYLPESQLYIECKPNLEFATIELYKEFSKQTKKKLMVFCPDELLLISNGDIGENYESINQLFCPKCKKYTYLNLPEPYICSICNESLEKENLNKEFFDEWINFCAELYNQRFKKQPQEKIPNNDLQTFDCNKGLHFFIPTSSFRFLNENCTQWKCELCKIEVIIPDDKISGGILP